MRCDCGISAVLYNWSAHFPVLRYSVLSGCTGRPRPSADNVRLSMAHWKECNKYTFVVVYEYQPFSWFCIMEDSASWSSHSSLHGGGGRWICESCRDKFSLIVQQCHVHVSLHMHLPCETVDRSPTGEASECGGSQRYLTWEMCG